MIKTRRVEGECKLMIWSRFYSSTAKAVTNHYQMLALDTKEHRRGPELGMVWSGKQISWSGKRIPARMATYKNQKGWHGKERRLHLFQAGDLRPEEDSDFYAGKPGSRAVGSEPANLAAQIDLYIAALGRCIKSVRDQIEGLILCIHAGIIKARYGGLRSERGPPDALTAGSASMIAIERTQSAGISFQAIVTSGASRII
jgi:hypothetical protein